jgi:hypothetical protein
MDGRDNTRRQPPLPTLFEATFANGATSPDDALLVTIEAFGELPFGDPDGVVWSPMGGALPQEGDRALVAESDDGSWWVVAWWSAAQTDGSSLGARVAAIEAGPEATTFVSSFSGGWVNLDADRPAGFYRDRGRVFLTGFIKSGTIGASAFTLPTGYRPTSVTGLDFPVESNTAFGVVIVNSTGTVVPAIGSNIYVSLNGISFRHA